ncbi:MAG: VOC family protein [Rhizobiaceae bacterium]
MGIDTVKRSAKLMQIAPVLPARNVTLLAAWYRDKLGFVQAFTDPSTNMENPLYVGVKRDGIELHIQWHGAEEWETMTTPLLKFVVDDVDALFAEYEPKGVFHEGTALRNTAWGTREFGFYDPDGNGLIFFRDLKPGEMH